MSDAKPTEDESAAAVSQADADMLEALVETMFLAAHADGDFSAEERKQFATSVSSLTGARVETAALDEMLKRFEAHGADERPARLAAIKGKLKAPAARRVAFSLAVRLVAADGIIRTTERELLLDLAEALDIDRDAAADVVKAASP